MNTDHLRSFLAIVERGSFSEAARHLGVTQPAVTFQVQRLEREVGARLLNRGDGHVSLTAAGEAFRDFARDVVTQEAGLERRLRQLDEAIEGDLVVGGSTVPGEFVVPRLLGAFCERYPGVRPTLLVGDTDAVLEWVTSDRVQVGFVGAEPADSRLHAVAFQRDELVLVVPPEHAWAGRDDVALGDLAGEHILVREAGSGSMRAVLDRLADAGVVLSGDGPRFGSTQALLAAVEAGFGAAFVSRIAADKALRLGTLRAVALRGVRLERDLFVVTVPARIDTRLLHAFVAFAEGWGRVDP